MTGRRGIRRQTDSTGTSFGRFGQNAVVSDGIVCLYMPCDAADATLATLACTPLVVWRSPSFLCLALGDAVLIVIDVFAIAYAPKHVSGSECALIGLLENILAPLWVSVWKSTSVSGA